MGIGPSHFMKEPGSLDEKRIQFIWEQAVMPYIEEQCFGDEERLKQFAYEELKANSRPTTSRRTVPAMRRIELQEYESHPRRPARQRPASGADRRRAHRW